MNELALFAGAGGGLLGTHAVGLHCVVAVEIGEHQRAVLAARQDDGCLPPFPIWDDIKTFPAELYRGTADVVSGGFPCQAFSSAARGKNIGEKNLWPHMHQVVRVVSPGYVFAENVSAKAIELAQADLEELGYKTEVLSLSAQDLGADHTRERFWLLAHTNDKSELRSTINAKVAGMPKLCTSLWEAYPGESRVVDGDSNRMDRYTAIGNGQLPVVAAAALWALANA